MLQTAIKIVRPLFTRMNVVLWTVIALTAAIAGPFGTFDQGDFATRLLYWSLVIVASASLGHLFHVASRALTRPDQPVRCDLMMLGFMTLGFTPVLWLLTTWLIVPSLTMRGGIWSLGGAVMAITTAILVLRRILPGFEAVGYSDRHKTPERPRLMDRLPDDERGTILRVSVRDHFVDVVTTQNTHTIRMRFGDAINEMDTVQGHCTHRSHWVADDAVVGVDQDKGKSWLVLSNGDRVPVSRTYYAAVEEAGLLQRGIGTATALRPVRTARASGRIRRARTWSWLRRPPV
jgi:hypothetical protein